MGQTQSVYSPAFETFISNYSYVPNKETDDLGVVMEKKANTADKILLATRIFENTTALEVSMKLVSTIQDYHHPNLANVLSHSEKNEFQCLSQTFRHAIAVEYADCSLQSLIKTKTEDVKEPHCWYIFKVLADVCNYMAKSGLPLGEVSPANVLVNDQGDIKLLNLDLLTGYRTCLERAFNFPGYHTTFAPEQLERLNHLNRKLDGIDAGKAEVFGIGMTVLCVATDEYVDAYYEWSNYVVNFDKVVKKINLLKGRQFSEEFIKILAATLEPQPEKRMPLVELVFRIDEHTNPSRKKGLSTILGLRGKG